MKKVMIEYRYVMVLINVQGKLLQLPYHVFNTEVFAKLRDHAVLGVYKYDVNKRLIFNDSIERALPYNNYSRYEPLRTLEPTQKIWRYIDLYKFEHLINSSSIYFTRIDRFKDKLEGMSPESCKKMILESTEDFVEGKVQQIKLYEERMEKNRKSSFVCCWHINDEFNPAMRELFSNNSLDSIVIETSVAQLNAVTYTCPVPILFAPIRYFDDPFYNQESYWFPTLFKRRCFESEQEYRSALYIDAEKEHDHINVSISLKILLTSVYINSGSSVAYKKKIKNMLKQKNLDISILKER